MWVLPMVFFSCFQMGFYFVTTGWIFEMGLCENSINSIQTAWQIFQTEEGAFMASESAKNHAKKR